ncbi:MAG: hypothetical protein JRH05_14850 [Deltaproteobacteria bacterium]|nr:hypothetical protein [Deltaproteobacteria bacterium]
MNPKISIILEKELLEEIDRNNPFSTRKEFLDQACRAYLRELKRKFIDESLARACRQSAKEDVTLNNDWEEASLEDWR